MVSDINQYFLSGNVIKSLKVVEWKHPGRKQLTPSAGS